MTGSSIAVPLLRVLLLSTFASTAVTALDSHRKPGVVTASAAPRSRRMVPPFGTQPTFHDQSTYWGRLQRFMDIINPKRLFLSDQELERCRSLLDEFSSTGKKPQGVTDEDLWRAKGHLDAVTHPVTKEKIFPLLTMAGFVPANIPIVTMMLLSKSLPVQVLSHWINQSYNTALNYANRSGDKLGSKQILQSYVLAIATACPLAAGLGKAFQRAPPSMQRFSALVPYCAVAAAGAANVLFTRKAEMTRGVPVRDEHGQVVGVSKKAGKACVAQTVLSRNIFLPIPIILLPGAIMTGLKKAALMPSDPKLKLVTEVLAITVSLGVGLPLAIAIFPQEAKFPVSALEPEFRNREDSKGHPLLTLFANKGL